MTTQTQPEVDSVIGQWPPVAHIIRKKDQPAREGTVALCGAKLMGIDLNGDTLKTNCQKCREVMLRELRGGQ